MLPQCFNTSNDNNLLMADERCSLVLRGGYQDNDVALPCAHVVQQIRGVIDLCVSYSLALRVQGVFSAAKC